MIDGEPRCQSTSCKTRSNQHSYVREVGNCCKFGLELCQVSILVQNTESQTPCCSPGAHPCQCLERRQFLTDKLGGGGQRRHAWPFVALKDSFALQLVHVISFFSLFPWMVRMSPK